MAAEEDLPSETRGERKGGGLGIKGKGYLLSLEKRGQGKEEHTKDGRIQLLRHRYPPTLIY